MFKQITIILLLVIIYSKIGHAQNKSEGQIIISAKQDSIHRVAIIPDDIFHQKVDVLLLTSATDTTSSRANLGYEIRWPSPSIDGSLVLTITKHQVYLRSSHDNPNPNYLYWFTNISDVCYTTIDKIIKSDTRMFEKTNANSYLFTHLYYKKFKPEKKISKKWTDLNKEQYLQDCLQKRYENLVNLVTFINKELPKNQTIPLFSKEDFENETPVRIAFFKEDID
ncbi:hypothetical protein [Flavobacterium adhaerens]|uniref:hypothetical protein n=1 Tax=Flavobacterium adhaerens TaxID=3149043 RepID=UPI0032B46626